MIFDCYVVNSDPRYAHIIEYIEQTPDLNLIGIEGDVASLGSRQFEDSFRPYITIIDEEILKSSFGLTWRLVHRSSVVFSIGLRDELDEDEEHELYLTGVYDYLGAEEDYGSFLISIQQIRDDYENRADVLPDWVAGKSMVTLDVITPGKTAQLNFDYLISIYRPGPFMYFTHTEGSSLTRHSFDEIDYLLSNKDFIRISPEAVVNLKHVQWLRFDNVRMVNGDLFLIHQKYKKRFLKYYQQHKEMNKAGSMPILN